MRPSTRFDRLLDASIVWSFDRTGWERHRKRFDNAPTRVLSGEEALVTGGGSGIGYAAAAGLIAQGVRTTIWGRRASATESAAAALGARPLTADLSDLARVKHLLEAWRPTTPLAALILNAGAMPNTLTHTAQGHECIWASQVLGHLLLLRTLAARGDLAPGCRVVWVASGGLYLQRLDLTDLTWAQRPYNKYAAYANAKRAQLILTSMLHDALADHSLHLSCMHPGWVDTPALRTAMPWFQTLLNQTLRDASAGADTMLWLVTTREPVAGGKFWFDREEVPAHLWWRTRETPQDREALWRHCRDALAPWWPHDVRATLASEGDHL